MLNTGSTTYRTANKTARRDSVSPKQSQYNLRILKKLTRTALRVVA